MLTHQEVGTQLLIYHKMAKLYILPQIDQKVMGELIFIKPT